MIIQGLFEKYLQEVYKNNTSGIVNRIKVITVLKYFSLTISLPSQKNLCLPIQK